MDDLGFLRFLISDWGFKIGDFSVHHHNFSVIAKIQLKPIRLAFGRV